MTPTERTAYFNQRGETSSQKYGFKIVAGATGKENSKSNAGIRGQ
jgi:hypothetical protein